jgi:ActR/RegA family two-component response regulator
VTAASGEAALDTLRAREFAMMISDVRMPGISGLETLRRARQEHPVLPVLLVTAYADIRDAVGAMRDGAVNYLAKPIDLDECWRPSKPRSASGFDSDDNCLWCCRPKSIDASRVPTPHWWRPQAGSITARRRR